MSNFTRAFRRHRSSVRVLAAQMAEARILAENTRQAVSDRIGYLVAASMGAAVQHWLGWPGVGGLATLYVISAFVAYRRYRAMPVAPIRGLR